MRTLQLLFKFYQAKEQAISTGDTTKALPTSELRGPDTSGEALMKPAWLPREVSVTLLIDPLSFALVIVGRTVVRWRKQAGVAFELSSAIRHLLEVNMLPTSTATLDRRPRSSDIVDVYMNSAGGPVASSLSATSMSFACLSNRRHHVVRRIAYCSSCSGAGVGGIDRTDNTRRRQRGQGAGEGGREKEDVDGGGRRTTAFDVATRSTLSTWGFLSPKPLEFCGMECRAWSESTRDIPGLPPARQLKSSGLASRRTFLCVKTQHGGYAVADIMC
ncbi:hypothetical protein THAOC_29584, partial [Thalassiosira oceanica]